MRFFAPLSAFFLITSLQAQPACNDLNAGFTYSVGPNGVQFSNGTTGTGEQTTWQWTFGDGATSNDGQPFHTYTTAGNYEVCLYAITIYVNGSTPPLTCVDTACVVVTIGGGDPCDDLEACFVASQTSANTVFFNNCTQPGTNSQYVWTFGDGSDGSVTSPTHTYLQPGSYSVCLKAYWNGCLDEYCTTIVVEGGTDPCDGLSADFWFGNNGIPTSIFYSASTGAGPHWLWSFGDGTYSDNGPQGTHMYTAAGSYELCLTVWDWIPGTDDTCSVTTCQLVVIEGGDPCDGFGACFVTNDLGNGTFFFDNCSSNQGNGQFYWTFGDGAVSTVVNAEHSYTQAGTYEVCLYAYLENCTDTTCTTVVVSGVNDPCDELEAAFTWSTTPNGTQFSNGTTGTGQSTTWHWTFGDGITSNDGQPFHTYAEPGEYEVCLYAISIYPNTAGGVITCVDTTCAVVVIESGSDPCDDYEACFVASQTGQYTVFFNNCTVPGTNTQYVWHFGDGSTGSGVSPTHIYDQPGTYTVCLTAYWNGCVDEYCTTVVVQGTSNPCEDLNAGFQVVVTGALANFQNAVVSGAFTYIWHFGDGTDGYGPNPTHSYPGPGTYTACLLMWAWNPLTPDTCFADHCELVTITGTPTPCDELEAGFTWTTTPNGTQFSNNTSGTGFSTTWHWTFGDGSTSNDGQPFHAYAEPGEYEVCLYAVSVYVFTGGNLITCTDTICAMVIVGGGDPCDGFETCFVTNDLGNGTYFFDNCSSNQGNGQFYWTFGDGTGSTVVNAEHHYSQAGTYEVCLYAYNGNCADTTCTTIVVEGGGNVCDGLEVAFTWNTTPNGTQFSSTLAGGGFQTTWQWTFGDGGTSDASAPFYHYDLPGTYQVCVVVTSMYETPNGIVTCLAEHCATIVIEGGVNICDQLVAGFTTTNTPNGTYFANTTTGTGFQTTWHWTFGDGGTSDAMSTSHIYDQPGTYQACLVVVSVYETVGGLVTCTNEICHEVVVGGGDPCDDLTACFVTNDLGNGTFFFDNCSSNQGNGQFYWTFGDGATSTVVNAEHHYTQAGTYAVCLYAYYENCVDTICATITVSGGGCQPFQVDFGYGVQGNAVVFEATASVPVVGYLWYFGDGNEGYGHVVTHLYEPPGPYNVCVTVWYWNSNTQDTCWAEHCEWVDPFQNGVGISETGGIAVRVYPNPARGVLTIDGLASPCDVLIYSPEGRLVLQQRTSTTRHSIGVEQLAPAIYSLELRTAEGSLWQRIAIE